MIYSDDFFEQLQNQFDANLPFVAYRKPNASLINGLLQDDDTVHQVLDYSENGFIFAPFDSEKETILIPILNAKTIACDFVITSQNATTPPNIKINLEQKMFHKSLVQSAIDAIKTDEFKKVVISRKEITFLPDSNPIAIFKRLLDTYETAFVYCFHHPKIGLWLGATPETLLQIKDNRLTTMSLAGTQEYLGTNEVLWNNKEKEEQNYVTNFIIESLQPFVSDIEVSIPETVRAGNLLHLKTTITASMNRQRDKFQDSSLGRLLRALHPTPAVCGLPKENAKQFILKNEGYNRGFYTGFLGELNLKERKSRNSNRHNVENDAYATLKTVSNFYVNLRCMELKENQAFIYVGGGITKDSIPENEWAETVSKSRVIKHIL